MPGSAQGTAHAQVLDALLVERLALGLVAAAPVEPERARLGVQRHALRAGGARLDLGLVQERRREAAEASVAADAQAGDAGPPPGGQAPTRAAPIAPPGRHPPPAPPR